MCLYRGRGRFDVRAPPPHSCSPVGVGDDVAFDLFLIHELNVTVHAFDSTPSSVDWIRQNAFPAR